MPSKQAASLSPEVEKRIAEIESMTTEQVRRVMFDCLSELPAGKITAFECSALQRAADKRITAIRGELLR